ncbi:MAG TPA: DUF262 domain-containing protein [Puia sp.]|nr:DUF262 domain-containing protein [Puia sp.]
MSNTLSIKSIGELLRFTFHVPDYQRGYRWQTKYQVSPLLADIWGYQLDSRNPDDFYCLQPVVVKAINTNLYELIDGQQRLTTILLILHYLNQTEFRLPKPTYSMHFATRIAQEDFLDIVDNEEVSVKNIDLFHLHQAYRFITSWFAEKEAANPAIRSEFYSKLVNRTKVIWYEIDAGTDEVDIFRRLNIGKIPLTNAELVKALFLSKSSTQPDDENKLPKQLRIASEWDRMEQTLQNPEFWYFICPVPDKYETRIEYLFDLMQDKKPDYEDLYTFYRFYEEFERQKEDPGAIEKIWLSVKEWFLTFDEWFHDRELYHLIGYLVTVEQKVAPLKKLCRHMTKTRFKEHLVAAAKRTIRDDVSELTYDAPKKEIRQTLLLFNILTILDSEKASIRFPFNHYHRQDWDIEHIRSKTTKDISGKDKENWAMTALQYFTGVLYDGQNEALIHDHTNLLLVDEKEFCDQLLRLLRPEKEDSLLFESLYEKLADYFQESEELEETDSLSNLTLLDQNTNRMYKNAFFPVKRKYIIEQEKKGVFIPLCTKNVFLKAYSRKLGHVMYWNQNDGDDYLTNIQTVLAK